MSAGRSVAYRGRGLNVDRVKRLVAQARATTAGKVVLKIGEDRALNWATQIAWSALLAVFPMTLAMAAVVGLVLGVVGDSSINLKVQVAGLFPDVRTQDEILTALNAAHQQSGPLAIVSFIGLVLAGSALFGTMEQAFATIYHAAPRSFIKQKLVSVLMMAVFMVFMLLVVGSSAGLAAVGSLSGVNLTRSLGAASVAIQAVFGVVAGFLLFYAIYFVVPNRKQRWRQVWPGALLAGALFELLTLVFPLYLEVNKGLQNYGKTFGLLFVLMAFLYFLGIITMVGVELNSVLYPVPVDRAAPVSRRTRAQAQ